jgi:hypothetical protein
MDPYGRILWFLDKVIKAYKHKFIKSGTAKLPFKHVTDIIIINSGAAVVVV